MFVVYRGEWYMTEFSGLEPMDDDVMDCDCLLWGDVWAVFEVIVLTLLLGF